MGGPPRMSGSTMAATVLPAGNRFPAGKVIVHVSRRIIFPRGNGSGRMAAVRGQPTAARLMKKDVCSCASGSTPPCGHAANANPKSFSRGENGWSQPPTRASPAARPILSCELMKLKLVKAMLETDLVSPTPKEPSAKSGVKRPARCAINHIKGDERVKR